MLAMAVDFVAGLRKAKQAGKQIQGQHCPVGCRYPPPSASVVGKAQRRHRGNGGIDCRVNPSPRPIELAAYSRGGSMYQH